ncbi:MAG: formate--tetrahydrofolate ligase [Armatimonadota bacterium]
MRGNLEIARSVKLRPILEVATAAGLDEEELELYGRHKAKVRLEALEARAERPDGKLVLVTAITPTPAGEGKSTMTVGLTQALQRIGSRAVSATREPSLGPIFGMKGGATGGGYSQVMPMEEINLHFTGDLHAITAANNLLASMVENHLHWRLKPELDPRTVTWKRCLDMNDRSLRQVVVGLGRANGDPRETGFEITAASEVMAVLSLAQSAEDLRARVARIVVGSDRSGRPVTAGELKASGAMTVLLRDALKPNLVQTVEGTPALVHGGPFGNIAHGCSSVLATRMALKLGEICLTEAGFGADLGAEKFLDIKCRQAGLNPDAAVLVATVRALKMHGGVPLDELDQEDLKAIDAGFANLQRHAENLRKFGLPILVAVNRFPSDTEAELEHLRHLCRQHDLPVGVADVWRRGGAGGEEVAHLLLETLQTPSGYHAIYRDDAPVAEKIETVAREVYRAGSVRFLPPAVKRLAWLKEHHYDRLPVCIAKTQYSFSDDPALHGAPEGHALTVRDLHLSAGAGFVVVYAGEILTMPGLPRQPSAVEMDLLPDGTMSGLF